MYTIGFCITLNLSVHTMEQISYRQRIQRFIMYNKLKSVHDVTYKVSFMKVSTVLSPYVLTGRDRRVTRIVNSDPNSECSFLASFWPTG